MNHKVVCASKAYKILEGKGSKKVFLKSEIISITLDVVTLLKQYRL